MNKISAKGTYNETKLLEIKYGLEAIYLNISKLLVFFTINYLIGNLTTSLIFFLFYIPLRGAGWGFHAKTSLQCWTISAILFIGLPLLVHQVHLELYTKIILCTGSLIAMWCWAPADTPKRPLVNPETRKKLKSSAITITLVYSLLIFYTDLYSFVIIALLMQLLLVNPFTYLGLNVRYKNHLHYKVV